VGGSNLVIWDYSFKPLVALKLVEFLTSYEVQSGYILQAGQIPARVDVLAGPPFTTDPYLQVIRQSLESGRSFTATYLWGKVEERLSAVVNNIWSQLFADPTLNIETAVAAQLKPLAAQLDQILDQR
jgi:ABC-type glycerol-3-phosphate transport system substrate-binding protein